MDLDYMAVRLYKLLVEFGRVTRLVEKSELGCCGVTMSQCHLLLEVFRRGEGKTSLSDLAAALGLDLSTVSRVVDGLVKQGLLCREVDSFDRRKTKLLLTDAGKRLVEDIDRGMREYVRAVLEQMLSDKREGVLESLEHLVEAMRKIRGGCCSDG